MPVTGDPPIPLRVDDTRSSIHFLDGDTRFAPPWFSQALALRRVSPGGPPPYLVRRVIRPLLSGVVFERDAIEPGERVPDMRFVVDRHAAVTLRVHVRERTVREPRSNLPAPHAIPGMGLAGNARETATLLPGEDIEEGALRR